MRSADDSDTSALTDLDRDSEVEELAASGERVALQRDAEGDLPPGSRVLAGRCIAAEDGRPLANCEIFLINELDRLHKLYAPTMEVARSTIADSPAGERQVPTSEESGIRPFHLDRLFLEQSALDALRRAGKYYQRMPDTRTDAYGRFRFEIQGLRGLTESWGMLVASPFRLPHERIQLLIPRDRVTDLGDIELHQGWRVSGRIVDHTRRGKTDVNVWIHDLPGFDEGGWTLPAITITEGRGQFAFSEPIPEGRWLLTATGAGLVPHAEWIHVRRQDLEVSIVIAERPSISGVLLLQDGRPAAGVELEAWSSDRVCCGQGTSDERGLFRVQASSDTLPPVRILDATMDLEMLLEPPYIDWGTQNLRLTVVPQAPLDLLLLDAKTGAPINGTFDVDVSGAGPNESFGYDSRAVQGRLQLTDMRSGPCTLTIGSEEDGWQWQRFELDVPRRNRKPIPLRLHKVVPFVIRVLTPDNKPAFPADVEITKPVQPLQTPAAHLLVPALLKRGHTGCDGTVSFGHLPAGQVVDIHVESCPYARMVLRGIRVTDQPQALDIKLTDGGVIEGRIYPALEAASGWDLFLIQPETGGRWRIWLTENGGFYEAGIPVGLHDVWLWTGHGPGKRVAQVRIDAQHDCKLEIKMPAPPHASVQLSMRGLPASHGAWTIWPCPVGLGEAPLPQPTRWMPGETLKLTLPVGTYRFIAIPVRTPGTGMAYYHSSRSLSLTKGQETQTTIEFLPRRTQLSVLHPDGRPAARTRLELQYRHPGTREWCPHLALRTNAGGKIDLQQLTPWPMRLTIPGTRLTTTPKTWTGQKKLTLQLQTR